MALKKIQYDVQLLSTETVIQANMPVVYTNDLNSAEFVFNISDMTPEQLAGATATTLLYMRDGSFFQNSDVNLDGTTFTYLLKENEGNHSGLAKIQLVVKIGTAEYASQLYSFGVVSGLETKVAVEVIIQDWTTLLREARAYIAQFLLDEEGRQATFVANEQDRQLAFEAAEALRQQKETERQGAEATRQQQFDDAQTARTNIFTQSETDRATAFGEAEALRQAGYNADHGRAASDHIVAETDHTTAVADHTMVQGFNTRLTAEETATANNKISAVKGKTFADVDARFEELETQSIAFDARTEFDAKNWVVNGDFSNGTTGWDSGAGTVTVANNILSSTAIGEQSYSSATQTGAHLSFDANAKIYIKAKVRVTNSSALTVSLQFRSTSLLTVKTIPTPSINQWYEMSGIISSAGQFGSSSYVRLMVNYADVATALGKVMEVQYVSVINLTATFGAGKEPTLAEMDRLMARFPNSWFDGTKPIQTIETLYQEKANKVQEAWITPTLINGWKTFVDSPVQYRKDEFGVVHFRGRLDPSTKTAWEFCTLPARYRPTANTYFNFGGSSYLAFTSTGSCQSTFNVWQSLEMVKLHTTQEA